MSDLLKIAKFLDTENSDEHKTDDTEALEALKRSKNARIAMLKRLSKMESGKKPRTASQEARIEALKLRGKQTYLRRQLAKEAKDERMRRLKKRARKGILKYVKDLKSSNAEPVPVFDSSKSLAVQMAEVKKKKRRPKGIRASNRRDLTARRPVKVAFQKRGVDYVSLAKKIMNKYRATSIGERMPYLSFVKIMWEEMGKDIPWRQAISEYREAYYINLGKEVPKKRTKKL